MRWLRKRGENVYSTCDRKVFDKKRNVFFIVLRKEIEKMVYCGWCWGFNGRKNRDFLFEVFVKVNCKNLKDFECRGCIEDSENGEGVRSFVESERVSLLGKCSWL